MAEAFILSSAEIHKSCNRKIQGYCGIHHHETVIYQDIIQSPDQKYGAENVWLNLQ
jgi:hypothetical protein